MITSVKNPKVQWVRKLQAQARARREEGLFIGEGVRLLEEARRANFQAALVLFSPSPNERGQALVEAWRSTGAVVEEVSPHVMSALSDTQTPQGVLAVLNMRAATLPDHPDFLLLLDGIRDPGNLGTILRTALAAGVQGVIMPPGVTDPWSPKVVRAAMGAHFRLPIQAMDWAEIEQYVQAKMKAGLQVLLADSKDGQAYTAADLRRPLALVIGGEAAGAGAPAAAIANGRIHIPMPGGAESLNAAVAAAILMFETARQRSSSG